MSDSHPRLTWEAITLQLRVPFHISYGVSETREAFWLRLAGDAGWGEGTIPPYYHVNQADTFALWEAAARRTDPFPDTPAEIPAWIGEQGPAPARCALDLALHDRIARQQGVPLYRLLEVPRPPVRPTSFTIPIASPEAMAQMAAQVPDYPIIKIKLGPCPRMTSPGWATFRHTPTYRWWPTNRCRP
jgi:L-alanine-DL-glutamate epimerase-like enolase superfamily enzyme